MYQTFKKAMKEKKIDSKNIKQLWQSNDNESSECMEEENTNDHSLNFEGLSSIQPVELPDAEQFSV
jgi:hypothetical protein